jgi:beta-glucosidase/6-phospho-beta-glucosidase/beta-galactosidase
VLPPRSELRRLTDPDWFLWATGIEDTFITAPWPATGRTLDEYELTGHYRRWREDLGLMAELGVRAARYGIPWHRVNPAPGKWDWSWPDRTLSCLLELGIQPVVDLVHYGLPGWIEGAYLHPDFHRLMAEYAGRLAERFRGSIRWYTPLNEPRITAWYCGKLGWWPPYRRGWTGFTAVMLGLCRGIVETAEALRSVDPEIVLAHVDATDVYESPDPTLAEEVERRQQIGLLALDLVSGRVTSEHPLRGWLRRQGAADADLDRFLERPAPLEVAGLNLYPMFSRKVLVRSPRGLRVRMPYADAGIIEQLARLYWERYGVPVWISETAARGSRRRDWMRDSVQTVARLRRGGVPLVGYTWWPMFALVAWAYRQSSRPVSEYLEQFGLWDLESGPNGDLLRVRTPLVDAYRALVEGGVTAVGRLAEPESTPRRRIA